MDCPYCGYSPLTPTGECPGCSPRLGMGNPERTTVPEPTTVVQVPGPSMPVPPPPLPAQPGYPVPPAVEAPPGADPSLPPPASPAAAPHPAGGGKLLAGVLAASLVTLVIALVVGVGHKTGLDRAPAALLVSRHAADDGSVARAPAIPGVPQPDPSPAGAPDGNNLFIARPSEAITPTIRITNLAPVTTTLVLSDDNGNERYRLVTAPGQTSSLQVAAGSYLVFLASDDPSIGSNSGDAVFRQHESYDAVWSIVPYTGGGDIHMGD